MAMRSCCQCMAGEWGAGQAHLRAAHSAPTPQRDLNLSARFSWPVRALPITFTVILRCFRASLAPIHMCARVQSQLLASQRAASPIPLTSRCLAFIEFLWYNGAPWGYRYLRFELHMIAAACGVPWRLVRSRSSRLRGCPSLLVPVQQGN